MEVDSGGCDTESEWKWILVGGIQEVSGSENFHSIWYLNKVC